MYQPLLVQALLEKLLKDGIASERMLNPTELRECRKSMDHITFPNEGHETHVRVEAADVQYFVQKIVEYLSPCLPDLHFNHFMAYLLQKHVWEDAQQENAHFKGLIAFLVTDGVGHLYIDNNQDRSRHPHVQAEPGHVILLPGYGFRGQDLRPRYYGRCVTNEMKLFAFRFDTRLLSIS